MEDGLADNLKWSVIFVSSSEDAQTIDELSTKELKWSALNSDGSKFSVCRCILS